MDVNAFFHTLFEQRLGLHAIGLEARYTELVKIIDRVTIPVFSDYIPAYYRTYLDLRDPHNLVKKEHATLGSTYYIDDPVLDMFNLQILGLEHMEPANYGNVDPYDPNSSAYYSAVIAQRNNIDLESVLMGSEYTYNRTLIDSSIPFKRYQSLVGPRTIYLRNWPLITAVEIILKVRWPNIASIPEEYREILLDLAMYDIEVYLWHELKYIEDIPIPQGTMSLRFNWENADELRKDYLKELRRSSAPDRFAGEQGTYFKIL